MPYIPKSRRKALANPDELIYNAGELNYVLCQAILKKKWRLLDVRKNIFRDIFDRYWENNVPSYIIINEIGGAVMNAAVEFQRRGKDDEYKLGVMQMIEEYYDWYYEVAGPYEDTKIVQNGDIFS
jgi:hypothetical protein